MLIGLDLVPGLLHLGSHLVDLRAPHGHPEVLVRDRAEIGMSLTKEERIPVRMEDRGVVVVTTQVIACGVTCKRSVVLCRL